MLFYDHDACRDFMGYANEHTCEYDSRYEDKAYWENMRAHPFNDWSYAYLGYFIEDEAQLLAFAEAYRATIAAGTRFEGELSVGKGRGTSGGDVLLRLRSLESLTAAKDPLALRATDIPVVIEWPEHHRHPGGHVVYLDGRREFVPYPGKFPMTPAAITALRDLDNYGPRR